MGTAPAHRQPEALRRADRDVGAELSRRPHQGQGERIARRDQQRVRRPGARRQRGVVAHPAVGRRVLDEDPEDPAAVEVGQERVADVDVDAGGGGTRAHNCNRLRMAIVGDEEHRPVDRLERGVNRGRHVHRLGGRGGLVEQRGVGDRQPGQLGDHRLERQQRLQPALRDLRLVGRVLRVPAGVLQHVALHDARHHRAVVAEPEVRAKTAVARRHRAQMSRRPGLAAGSAGDGGFDGDRALPADRGRDRLGHQLLHRATADDGQHLVDLRGRRPEVPAREGVQRPEIGLAQGFTSLLGCISRTDPPSSAPRNRRRPST